MANGYKTGGRKKGTPNKKTQEIQEILDQYSHDPVESLVLAARDEGLDVNMRIKINMELMQYLHPKRKAVEHTGQGGGPIEFLEALKSTTRPPRERS